MTIMSEEISKSKQKRLAQEQARKEKKAKAAVTRFWTIFIPLLLIGFIVVGAIIYQSGKLDYSKYLTAEGKIRGVKASDYVNVNYTAMTFSRSELLPEDEVIEGEINSALSSHATLSEDAGIAIKDGDRIVVTYTNTLADGTVYEAQENETGGKTLTLGTEQIAPGVDAALVGHHVGDTVSIPITPEATEADPAPASTTYTVTITGLYVEPELNDEFIATYYGDQATTVEGYRQSLIDSHYKEALRSAVTSSLSENSTVSAYPDKYVSNMEKVLAAQDEESLNYYNTLYQQYLGAPLYNSVLDMYGCATEADYMAQVHERALQSTADALEIQFIYEAVGLSNPTSDVQAYITGQGNNYEELKNTYGAGYLAQSSMTEKVIQYLMDTVTVTE